MDEFQVIAETLHRQTDILIGSNVNTKFRPEVIHVAVEYGRKMTLTSHDASCRKNWSA
jgi:hypothetical protein